MIQPRVALLLNNLRSVGNGLFDKLHYSRLGLESVTRRIVALAEVGPEVGSGDPADEDEIQCGGVQKILGKSALVFLQLEIVFVFGKIASHGDEFVPDCVPRFQHFI